MKLTLNTLLFEITAQLISAAVDHDDAMAAARERGDLRGDLTTLLLRINEGSTNLYK